MVTTVTIATVWEFHSNDDIFLNSCGKHIQRQNVAVGLLLCLINCVYSNIPMTREGDFQTFLGLALTKQCLKS